MVRTGRLASAYTGRFSGTDRGEALGTCLVSRPLCLLGQNRLWWQMMSDRYSFLGTFVQYPSRDVLNVPVSQH